MADNYYLASDSVTQLWDEMYKETLRIAAKKDPAMDTTTVPLTPEIVMAKTTPPTQQTAAQRICYFCHNPLCEICGVCETDGCALTGLAIWNGETAAPYRYLMAKSQKIRGFVVLAGASFPIPAPYRVVLDEEDIPGVVLSWAEQIGPKAQELFARPCPLRPRHGFVDSEVVGSLSKYSDRASTEAKLRTMLSAARDADPGAELLLLPKIDSIYNLVITPTRLAVGHGHDGATAGAADSGVLTIPLVGTPFSELTKDLLKKAAVSEDDDPYIEAVVTKGGVILDTVRDSVVRFTQVRAGVKVPTSVGRDYIPEAVRVERVLDASGDLLEWERQTATIERGTVVYGGTIISHYGVHCMFNHVPIMTSRRPVLGEILTPTTAVPLPSPDAVVRGLAAGALVSFGPNTAKLPEMSAMAACKYLLPVAHNAAAMGGEEGVWIGAAVSFMLRVGMAASHGEARHASAETKALGRGLIYTTSMKDFFSTRDTIHNALYLFKYYPGWGSGYGGKAWTKCTESIIALDRTALELMQNPSEAAVAKLVSQLHESINQAHNGGWWLNKFIRQECFDHSAQQSLFSVSAMAPAAIKIAETLSQCALIESTIEKWRAAKHVEEKAAPGAGVAFKVDPDADDDTETCGFCPVCTYHYYDSNIGSQCSMSTEICDYTESIVCEGVIEACSHEAVAEYFAKNSNAHGTCIKNIMASKADLIAQKEAIHKQVKEQQATEATMKSVVTEGHGIPAKAQKPEPYVPTSVKNPLLAKALDILPEPVELPMPKPPADDAEHEYAVEPLVNKKSILKSALKIKGSSEFYNATSSQNPFKHALNNINGTLLVEAEKVTAAQVRVTGGTAHLQYRVKAHPGSYFSVDAPCAQDLTGKHWSWSGSAEKSYVPLETIFQSGDLPGYVFMCQVAATYPRFYVKPGGQMLMCQNEEEKNALEKEHKALLMQVGAPAVVWAANAVMQSAVYGQAGTSKSAGIGAAASNAKVAAHMSNYGILKEKADLATAKTALEQLSKKLLNEMMDGMKQEIADGTQAAPSAQTAQPQVAQPDGGSAGQGSGLIDGLIPGLPGAELVGPTVDGFAWEESDWYDDDPF